MKKQLQLFLTQADEMELSRLLKKEFPSVQFLNDNVWTISPDCRVSIEDCDSGRVYLYRGRLEQLPTVRRANGDIEGPIGGCVIQILRPVEKDGLLLSGRVAVGADDCDAEMREFVCGVWECVKRIGKVGVVTPSGTIDRHYLIGHHARKAVADGVIRLVDRAVGLQYEPV